MTDRTIVRPVRTLTLRLDPGPEITVLFDGEPAFFGVTYPDRPHYAHPYLGRDPELLLAEPTPLLPARPHRVALGCCDCGYPGCGSLAPVVELRDDGRVSWSDFRVFTGRFEDGVVDAVEPDDGRATTLPDVLFDLDQYVEEVHRAFADRRWDNIHRQTGRATTALLRRHEAFFDRAGYEIDGARSFDVDGAQQCTVSLLHSSERSDDESAWDRFWRERLHLTVPTSAGSPDQRAAEVRTALLGVPAERWVQAYAGRSSRVQVAADPPA